MGNSLSAILSAILGAILGITLSITLGIMVSDTPHYENEVPFKVPQGWEWCRLSEIANYGGGKTPSMDNKQYWSNGTNLWITSKDMKSERITDSMMKISNEALDIMTQYEPGTLLMVTRSGILRHSLPIAILEKMATVNQDLKTISLYLKGIHEYVYYAIKAREHYILKEYHKDGTTVDSINFEKFAEIPLPIPPYNEQKRIVTAIKHWLSFIEELEKEANDLESSIQQTKSKILDLAIHGQLVPQDPNDEPATELLKRINPSFVPCDNAHYENVPSSWIKVPLGNICTLNEGEPITDKEYLYIDVKGLRTGNFASKQSGKYVPVGTTLILVDGENSGEVFYTPVEGYQGSTMKVLNIDSNMNTQYVLYFVNLHQRALRENKVGSAIPHLNKKMFRELIIPIPPISEQERIVEAILQYYRLLDNISANL